MPLSYDDVDAIADLKYSSESFDHPHERVFALLVDVADRYVSMMEELASDDPAPFFAGTTPMEMTMRGLQENLDMKRNGTSPQHR